MAYWLSEKGYEITISDVGRRRDYNYLRFIKMQRKISRNDMQAVMLKKNAANWGFVTGWLAQRNAQELEMRYPEVDLFSERQFL